MRVLIGECVPRQLKNWLAEAHDVATVFDAGWSGMKNGALLREANQCFDVLITADQNLYHQQSFAGLTISILVLPTNRLRLVRIRCRRYLSLLTNFALLSESLLTSGRTPFAGQNLS